VIARYDLSRDHYLTSPEGLLAQHRRRQHQQLHFSIKGIEPRQKGSMTSYEKEVVQKQLLEALVRQRRRAFRGPLALRLTLWTTDKVPPHSHNIAKNLLDLFGAPRSGLVTRRRGLLYANDYQVHALSVTCHHGQQEPRIYGVAAPLASLLADIDLVAQYEKEHCDDNREWERSERFDEVIDEANRMRREEAAYRERFGNRAFDSLFRFAKQQAQEIFLGRAAVTPLELAELYDVSGRARGIGLAEIWEQTFFFSPLRIRLSELPQVSGASSVWEQEIETKLRDFQARLGWLIDPLLVPVALEVVIKPPPRSRQNALHDLDNVLRDYLIPRVVGILKPISDYAFTLNEEALMADRFNARLPRPPLSTKSGVSRYEAWRLPPAKEGAQGFVGIAIVSDLSGHGDLFGQIDDATDAWRESLERPSYSTARRRRY
jgi:hypothetical protein